MFSPRLLAVFALVAAASSLPTDKPLPKPITSFTQEDVDDNTWFSIPLLGNLFAPLWRLFPSFDDFGPKIEDDAENFKVTINVKDYAKDDLKVKVKGSLIIVQGNHETGGKDGFFATQFSQFSHAYTLPVNASGNDVTAELSTDGYLTVTAPRNGGADEKSVDKNVEIKESGVAYKKEEATTSKPSQEDDRKEPTTPPTDREETTDKDQQNSIPHGNEINP